jgi:DNA helicase-2/ATP-dependent DNA helicase PcrA
VHADDLLHSLNEAQRDAVSAPSAPILVLAGAGSGKTRVLVHRVAWLISQERVSPHSILAVTFTNKAAGEMRGRIEGLLGVPGGALWIGTFHGLSHRLLRLHWREAGLVQNFQILDSEDQLRLIRKVVRQMELDEARWVPKEIQYFVNAQKDEGRRPKHLADEGDPTRRQMIKLYAAYEEQCRRLGVVDFAELLLRCFEVLRDQPQLLDHYRRRFRHVLVDEFQDTNSIQYEWVRLLCGPDTLPFVVGDDDQSIYGWRGAKVENIRRYQRDFPGTKVFRLEQNYRSTATILNAANALIANNTGRMGKTLWTSGDRGEPIRLYAAFNERDEAEFVVERIRDWVRMGGARQGCAVLYRSNAQSRVIEEALIQHRIPYRVYGGLRFFERAEIKDALAYLRLISSRIDDPSFERVVNLPTRGIGAKSLDAVREHARAHGGSLWEASHAVIRGGSLGAKGAQSLNAFLALIEKLAGETKDLPLHEQVDAVINGSGLVEHYRKEKGDRGEARVENLEELVSAARGYSVEQGSDLPPLESFLAHAVLESGEGQAGEWEDSVQMMTLHTAKGLEFPVVFLCGLEDGLFPHQRSVTDIGGLEEERRLAYVGVTRAMQRLYVTYAEQRRLHGVDQFGTPSRFIAELPPELVEEVRPRVQVSRPLYGGGGSGRGEWDEYGRPRPGAGGYGGAYGGGGNGGGSRGGYGGGERYGSGSTSGRGGAGAGTTSRPRRDDYPAGGYGAGHRGGLGGATALEEPASHGFRLGQRVRHGKFGDGVILRLDGTGAQTQVEVNFERAGRKVLMLAYANLQTL